MGTRLEIERFDEVLDRVRATFPELRMDIEGAQQHVDAAAEMPVQPGLDFRVAINLQGDELHLNVGNNFWVEWFPCGEQEVVDAFIGAVIGVLSGDHRIVEHYLFGRARSAVLERPNGREGWKRLAYWAGGPGFLIPLPTERRVLQNTNAAILRGRPLS